MTQESQKNNAVLIVIAIISVVGTVIAATINVMGNYSVEKIRQETELTRIALVSTNEAQAKATPKLINIILTNLACVHQDYYVDGKLMVSSIEPKAKVAFDITPGEHQVYVCSSNTNKCSDAVQVNWTTSTTANINLGTSCPTTITLTNLACIPQDYYVDGKLMVSSIEPKASVAFDITPGEHQVYVCSPNTNKCSDTVQVDWTTSTTANINPGTSCP